MMEQRPLNDVVVYYIKDRDAIVITDDVVTLFQERVHSSGFFDVFLTKAEIEDQSEGIPKKFLQLDLPTILEGFSLLEAEALHCDKGSGSDESNLCTPVIGRKLMKFEL